MEAAFPPCEGCGRTNWTRLGEGVMEGLARWRCDACGVLYQEFLTPEGVGLPLLTGSQAPPEVFEVSVDWGIARAYLLELHFKGTSWRVRLERVLDRK